MYNVVDSIIVGNYVGRDALAAVGASTSLIYLLIAFSQGAAVGAGVVVSLHVGAKDKKGVHSSVYTALALSVILGLILTVGGILFSRPLMIWMNAPTEWGGSHSLCRISAILTGYLYCIRCLRYWE